MSERDAAVNSPSPADSLRLASVAVPLSTPLRNLSLTLALTTLAFWLFAHLWGYTGYDILIVGMGWPHVLFGFAFYFAKVLRGEPGARFFFLTNSLLTLAICTVHYFYIIVGFIYIYFLYHAFRDEVFIYLQTRASHDRSRGVFEIAGVAPLILLLLIIPEPDDFRSEMRLVKVDLEQVVADSWTRIEFAPVANSQGRSFYFYLQSPGTEGSRALTAWASGDDVERGGEIRINDEAWPGLADLIFRPHYANQQGMGKDEEQRLSGDKPVLLTGGHRVGQTFVAGQDDLNGISLPISQPAGINSSIGLTFGLASPPLLPLSAPLANLRLAIMILLGAVLLWKIIVGWRQNPQLWVYLAFFVAMYVGLQFVLRTSQRAGYVVPLLFHFVVVFHYFSWYVFSFDKLRAFSASRARPALAGNFFDRLLGHLRTVPKFAAAVIALNLVSFSLALWYTRMDGPDPLRYAFAYDYFLYFLVFHVSFSFGPKPLARPVTSPG